MTQPTKIPRAFAESGDKNSIPDSTLNIGFASWQEGFPQITSEPFANGGVAPKRADFNGIFNALSLATVWQQQGGFYAYDNTTDYEVGNVVEYSGDLYKCLVANGPNSVVKAPTDTTVWDKVLTASDAAGLYLPLTGGSLSGAVNIIKDASGNSMFCLSNPNATKGSAPPGARYASIGFYGDSYDAYTKRLGVIETTYKADQSVSVQLGAYVADTLTNTTQCLITANTAADGTIWTSAPTPATSDNSTKIATTAFVNNRLPYETGTWTPVVYGNTTAGTYTPQGDGVVGFYAKLGPLVFVTASINFKWTSEPSGSARIKGFPFVADSAKKNERLNFGGSGSMLGSYRINSFVIASGQSWGYILTQDKDNNDTNICNFDTTETGKNLVAAVNSTVALTLTGFYFTSA